MEYFILVIWHLVDIMEYNVIIDVKNSMINDSINLICTILSWMMVYLIFIMMNSKYWRINSVEVGSINFVGRNSINLETSNIISYVMWFKNDVVMLD